MFETSYLDLLRRVIDLGEKRESRAGDTRSLFGATLAIKELAEGFFPLLTTRKIYYKPVFGELAAFIQGATRLQQFKDYGCNYWDENAHAWSPNRGCSDANANVGRIYGAQWRRWYGKPPEPIDQLQNLVDGIITDPTSRRHIVTAWQPAELLDMCLPPCHIMFQCYVAEGTRLDMMIYMRSVDLCIGLPSDIALYAALLVLLADETDYRPGRLLFTFGDAHVYENHVETALTQLRRTPALPPRYNKLDAGLFEFMPSDIQIFDYNHHEPMGYAFNV